MMKKKKLKKVNRNPSIELAKAEKVYNDILILEKGAMQNLHWSLQEVEDADYYLLMDILNVDEEASQNNEVYDDPMELMKKINTEGHT